MNTTHDADRLILEWLAADRGRLDSAGAEAAIASTRHVPQRRGLFGIVGAAERWPLAGSVVGQPTRRIVLLAAVVAVALVATAAALVGNRLSTTILTPTPSFDEPSPVATTAPSLPPATTAPSPLPAAGSPANGPIIVTGEGVWASGLDGHPVLVELPDCPYFSPDGRSLAYLRSTGADTGLVVADADGSNPRRVWHGTLSSQTPWVMLWSPNSARVALTQTRDAAGALVVADRATATSLNNDWGSREFPGELAFSPDGTKIAAIFGESDTSEGIEIGAVGESSHTVVATAPHIRTIAWSPDGTMIAYVAATTGDRTVEGGGDLYVVGVDGSPARLIDGGSERYYGVAWSPDGRFLAATNDGGPTVVFDRAGSEVLRFANTGDYLVWSPDSRFIAGGLLQDATNIQVVEVATGTVTRISFPSSRLSSACQPAWQPIPAGQ